MDFLYHCLPPVTDNVGHFSESGSWGDGDGDGDGDGSTESQAVMQSQSV